MVYIFGVFQVLVFRKDLGFKFHLLNFLKYQNANASSRRTKVTSLELRRWTSWIAQSEQESGTSGTSWGRDLGSPG